jgi:hypothetical protein
MPQVIHPSDPTPPSNDLGVKLGRAEAVLAAMWLGALALAFAVSSVLTVRISITLGVAIGVGLAL